MVICGSSKIEDRLAPFPSMESTVCVTSLSIHQQVDSSDCLAERISILIAVLHAKHALPPPYLPVVSRNNPRMDRQLVQ